MCEEKLLKQSINIVNTAIPQYRNTAIPQYRNTAIPQYRNTAIPQYRNKISRKIPNIVNILNKDTENNFFQNKLWRNER
jgi:hypothetical protein